VNDEDVLAQFSRQPEDDNSLNELAGSLFGETPAPAPAVPEILDVPVIEGTVPEHGMQVPDALEVDPTPAPDDYDPFVKPVQPAAPSVPVVDSIDDLLVMPAGMTPQHPDNSTVFPTLDAPTVPTAPPVPQAFPTLDTPTVPTSAPAAAVPTLNVPAAPPAPAAPAMPVPPAAYPAGAPFNGYAAAPQPLPGYPQTPVQPAAAPAYSASAAPQQNNFFAVPSSMKQQKPAAKPPLFVGYSADGRQIFQTYDEKGNPIPITEPVYSAPPEQKSHPLPSIGLPNTGFGAPGVQVMDMDDLMASMGIPDPKKKKQDEGKAINYTEYHIPQKKNKPAPKPAKPAASMPDLPTGPVSAAEAKRRKKVDKINKEFEKQLRARGIDPKTGGIIVDPKK
jgi:hypothetical protein